MLLTLSCFVKKLSKFLKVNKENKKGFQPHFNHKFGYSKFPQKSIKHLIIAVKLAVCCIKGFCSFLYPN